VKSKPKIAARLNAEDATAFRTKPLCVIDLKRWIQSKGLENKISENLPFNISKHPATKTHIAKNIIQRMVDDKKIYADTMNNMKRVYMFDVTKLDREEAKKKLEQLLKTLRKVLKEDEEEMPKSIRAAVEAANETTRTRQGLEHRLRCVSGQEKCVDFVLLAELSMSSTCKEEVKWLKPCIDSDTLNLVDSLTANAMMRANRIELVKRCERRVLGVISLLQEDDEKENLAEIELESDTLAKELDAARHFIQSDGSYDPRFLVFEFTYGLMLRKAQVAMIQDFMARLEKGQSTCRQMIMGAGKTTVVAPMLSLMLGDGKSLVMQVVPRPLLEFSRGVLRERFSALVQKAVFTFRFARYMRVEPKLYRKIVEAIRAKAVVVSHPTALKSFALKFVELLHRLDLLLLREIDDSSVKQSFLSRLLFKSRRGIEGLTDEELKARRRDCRDQIEVSTKVLKLFHGGVCYVRARSSRTSLSFPTLSYKHQQQ
jgi:hypothetical protein